MARRNGDGDDLQDDPWAMDDDPPEEEVSRSKVIPELVKKALLTGMGAVFSTEEVARNALNDMKLPKEAMGYISGQVDRTKRELVHTLARELRTFLDGLEMEDLLAKTLSGSTFEIQTRIRVVPNEQDGGVQLQVTDKKTALIPDERVGATEKAGAAEKTGAKGKAEAAGKKSTRRKTREKKPRASKSGSKKKNGAAS